MTDATERNWAEAATSAVCSDSNATLVRLIEEMRTAGINSAHVLNHLIEDKRTSFCRYSVVVILIRMHEAWTDADYGTGKTMQYNGEEVPIDIIELREMLKRLLYSGASVKNDFDRVDYSVLARLGHKMLVLPPRGLSGDGLERLFGLSARSALEHIAVALEWGSYTDSQDSQFKHLLDACDGGLDQLTFFLSTTVQAEDRYTLEDLENGYKEMPQALPFYCIVFRLIAQGASVTRDTLESYEQLEDEEGEDIDSYLDIHDRESVPEALAGFFGRETNPIVAAAIPSQGKMSWFLGMEQALHSARKVATGKPDKPEMAAKRAVLRSKKAVRSVDAGSSSVGVTASLRSKKRSRSDGAASSSVGAPRHLDALADSLRMNVFENPKFNPDMKEYWRYTMTFLDGH